MISNIDESELPDVDELRRVIIPVIKNVSAQTIADQLVGVQPMSEEMGEIYLPAHKRADVIMPDIIDELVDL